MAKSVHIASGIVNAQLIKADTEVINLVSKILSYEVANAEHHRTGGRKGWSGRSTFYERGTDRFPAGFVPFLVESLKNLGYGAIVHKQKLPEPLGDPNTKVDEFGSDPIYDYQPKTVEALLFHGIMIAQVATGGGKSRIARMAYARIRRPTLFLTTRKVLMYQMKESFEENMKIRVGVLGDSEWSPVKGFNVAMVQTLASRLRDMNAAEETSKYVKAHLKEVKKVQSQGESATKKYLDDLDAKMQAKVKLHYERREKTIKILQYFEFVIAEEAHEASGNAFFEVMSRCKRAAYRLALTATPFMKDEESENMKLMACCGVPGIVVSEKLLIDRGILAKPYFKYIPLKKAKAMRASQSWPEVYGHAITRSPERNRHILRETMRAAEMKLPVVVLVQRKEHGKRLNVIMTRMGIRSTFIFGESSKQQRDSAKNNLLSGELQVIIGSTILDVGVDMPAITLIILAGGGKGEIALRQRIGRGLRKKQTGPNIAYVVDFQDAFHKILRDHSYTRRAIIENTDGFGENVLQGDQDFNYAAFCDPAQPPLK